MNINFIAQSGFIIETDSAKRICIDLWLKNPINPISLDQVPKIDYVFITHDHFDHDMQSGLEIAKRDEAKFISNKEIAALATKNSVQNTFGGAVGETIQVSSDLEVVFTNAKHTSDTGIPLGFIIKTEDKTIYHMGDTDYIEDFKKIGNTYQVDLLLVPIGGTYTMDIVKASDAVADLKPKRAIPIHYNTFPQINADANVFKTLCNQKYSPAEILIMQTGESVNL